MYICECGEKKKKKHNETRKYLLNGIWLSALPRKRWWGKAQSCSIEACIDWDVFSFSSFSLTHYQCLPLFMGGQWSGHITSCSNSPTSSLCLEKKLSPSVPTNRDCHSQVSGWRVENSVIPKCFLCFLPESPHPNEVAG